MIRLTRCHRPDHAKEYFQNHLATGDNPAQPAAPSVAFRAVWIGPALKDVGIPRDTQPVADQLVRLSRGLHPTQRIRLAPAVNRTRAYYDLTISPPKTISLAALLLPNHPSAQNILYAHKRAVDVVTQVIGRLTLPRSGTGPGTWMGAVFHHTHTREGDPHLHTHLILPNLVRNQEKQWRALEVNIAGFNRLRLELIYGHHLARGLRRMGLGPEIVMRPNGLPELRPLLPLVKKFSGATRAVLAAARKAEAERAKVGPDVGSKHAGGTHPRSQLPVPTNKAALNRRRRLADQLRRAKPKDADDPVRLSDEAERWRQALDNQHHRALRQMLDDVDLSNPRRRRKVLDKLPPSAAVIVNQAFNRLYVANLTRFPPQPKTSATLLRATIAESAGRHDYNALRAACIATIKSEQRVSQKVRAKQKAENEALAQASYAALTQPVARTAPTATAASQATRASAPAPSQSASQRR